jgi:hypothetical protein
MYNPSSAASRRPQHNTRTYASNSSSEAVKLFTNAGIWIMQYCTTVQAQHVPARSATEILQQRSRTKQHAAGQHAASNWHQYNHWRPCATINHTTCRNPPPAPAGQQKDKHDLIVILFVQTQYNMLLLVLVHDTTSLRQRIIQVSIVCPFAAAAATTAA